MAGFLGIGNFEKPGKGVDKNDKKKKGLSLFSELLFRKFGSYLLLNLIYFISIIPGTILIWFPVHTCIYDLANVGEEQLLGLTALTMIIALFISVIFSVSPLSSGYYYILRRYADEQHAWLISDFFEKFKNNWKRSLLFYVTDILVIAVCAFIIRLYVILMLQYAYMTALLTLFIILLIVYAVMVPYKWIMLVTVDLKIKDIYKNSLFLVLGCFRSTITYIIATAVYLLLLFGLFSKAPLFGLLFMFLLGFSAYGLVQAIATYPAVKEHIISKDYYSED